METQTLETTKTETVAEGQVEVAPPAQSADDVAVTVDGVEVAVTDTEGELELTPATGFVAVLVLGLLAVTVVKLRKK